MKRREFLTAATVAGGAAAASPTAVAAQDETETPTGTQEGTPTDQGTSTPTGDGGGGGGGGNTWTFEMNDSNEFVPDSQQVRPGDTVVWENVGSSDHSVTAYEDNIPDGADYWASGGFDSQQAAQDGWPEGAIGGGESFEHTFETEGTHEYFCIPHEQVGMTGTVEVTSDAPTPTPEAGGGGQHEDPEHWGVPFQAHFVGLSTALMVVVSIVYTFFVLKYGESPNIKGGSD